MHPASHRGFSKIQSFRYIPVAQAVHEMHRDWQAVLVRKTPNESKEFVPQPVSDMGPWFSYYIECHLRPARSGPLSTNVERYTVQPSAEKLRSSQFSQIAVGPQECFLGNVFRVGTVQRFLVREREYGVLILPYDIDESAASAVQHKPDKIGIALFSHGFYRIRLVYSMIKRNGLYKGLDNKKRRGYTSAESGTKGGAE